MFLAFVAGLALGVTGKTPAPMMSKAIAEAKNGAGLLYSAVFSFPTQHLRPRLHEGDGVTVSQPEQMQPGVTLLTGLFGQALGFRLYAADGTLLREWPIDFFKVAPDEMKHRYHALIHGEHLYPNGDIVANLDGRGMIRLDACGAIKWQNRDMTHHSIHADEYGAIWAPILVRGQSDPAIWSGTFSIDQIARFDPETGKRDLTINLLKSLHDGPGPMLIQPNGKNMNDVLHVNDVEVLSSAMAPAFPMFAAGDILVSPRHLHQIWVLDGTDHRVKWWHAGPFVSQHDPDFEPDGTISMFDNRASVPPAESNDFMGTLGGSRILRIDPATGRNSVVYRSTPDNVFYSTYRGKQTILPNGNVLIAETDGGRAFEVTKDGTVVWEYINGFDAEHVGWVMGATRYPESYASIADVTCD
jgi:hypothetical protein